MNHLHEFVRFTELNLLFVFSMALLNPVLSPYLKSLGFSDVWLSLVFSVTPLVLIFTSPIIGKLSDDIGRRTVISVGIVCEMIAIMLYLHGGSTSAVIAARALSAIASGAVTMTTLAKIEDGLPETLRGKYAGVSLSVEYLGRISAPILSGFLADRLFVEAPMYTAIFILACAFLLMPGQKIEKRRPRKTDLDWLGGIRGFLSHRGLCGMAILGIVMHATFPALTVFLPLYIVETLGLSYVYVGYAYFAIGVTHLLQFEFGRWSDKSAYRVVLLGTLISGIFLAAIFWSSSYLVLLVLLFLKGIGNSMWNISAWTLMSNIGEKENLEGEVIGSYISIAKVGSFLSYVVSGFVVQAYGMNSLFLANGLLIVFGTVLAYPLLKDSR